MTRYPLRTTSLTSSPYTDPFTYFFPLFPHYMPFQVPLPSLSLPTLNHLKVMNVYSGVLWEIYEENKQNHVARGSYPGRTIFSTLCKTKTNGKNYSVPGSTRLPSDDRITYSKSSTQYEDNRGGLQSDENSEDDNICMMQHQSDVEYGIQ